MAFHLTGPVGPIVAAFAARGHESYGEHVSQTEHALQCAGLARAEGAPEALVAAALLHDVGHLIDGRGHAAEADGRDARHEAFGAAWLRPSFGAAVTAPIALHVAAKRYLCATDPAYEEALSPASRLSLELQGGRFSAAEAARFAARPHAADAVRLRRWDDAAKVPGLKTPPLETYADLLLSLAKVARSPSMSA